MTIKGTRGNDHLKGTAQADIFDLSLGGDDTVTALGGNDTFLFKAAFTAKDQINGGGGTDVLSLAGDYSHGVVFGATTIVGVETITLGAHHDYKLTTNDANVAKKETLTIDGSKLAAADTLTFNGVHETNGHFDIIGGKGNDVLTGGALSDTFTLTAGGNDTANGGAGNDTFALNGTLSATDKINGGLATDVLDLNGIYTGSHALVFGAKTVLGVEKIVLAAGHNYSLTTADATVASGATLSVNASALGAANTLTFNGSHETDGSLTVIGGAGNDHITGGQFNNNFDLSHGGDDTATGGVLSDNFNMGSHFTAADQLNGGGDFDYLNLDGNTTVTMTDTTIQNIEWITLGGGHDYSLTLANGSIGAGQTLTVDAGSLQDGDHFTLNASAVADGILTLEGINSFGVYNFTGGAGDDLVDVSDGDSSTTLTYHGSLGGDTVYAAAATNAHGTDTFIYTDPTQSTGSFATHDLLRFVNYGTDKMEVSGFADAGGVSFSGNTATINSSNFDGDLAAAVSGHLAAHGVTEVIAGGGDEINHAYLVLDINGDAAYTNGQDYVFEIDGSETGSLTSSFFT